ncbi:MAG: hypothetical protein WCF40_13460 [Desulfobacterales bacterium]
MGRKYRVRWQQALAHEVDPRRVTRRDPVLGKPFDAENMNRLFQQVCSAATEIIEHKSYTNTAIGTAIIRPVKVLLEDQKSVSTVSRMLTGKYGLKDVCLSVPSVVGIAGVVDALLPRLDAAELKGLQRSAAFLKDNISGLNIY